MFRAEASALIAVPSHPNLARFVTFDLAARPKPILVMELVEGATLEAGVQSRALDMPRCFAVLEDVLEGLVAMHSVGVGHLDLKPSNVVLRKGTDAVLVDFGLAGRHIRPGCATGPYGAPEVWGAVAANAKPTPQAADVYAFGCLAFEALTGRTLFKADSELAQVSMHIAHDGFPPLLKELASRVGMAPLAELLFWTLRRDAAIRPSAAQVREDLNRLAPQFASLKWPLSI
jgi:serine/threonine protein kinase